MVGLVTAIVAIVVFAAAEGYSAYQSTKAATAQKKYQQSMLDMMNKPLPEPSPDTSLADAQKAADDQRRTIMASGGKTDLTQGTATLDSTSVQKHTLLGQ